jgi:adenylate cyclase class IV
MPSSTETTQREVEAERKYPVTEAEIEALTERVEALGLVVLDVVTQEDTYLPTESPDDTRRLRREICGDRIAFWLTLKQPGSGPNGHSARIETERPIGVDEYDRLLAEVADPSTLVKVKKTRAPFAGELATPIGNLKMTFAFDLLYNLAPEGKFTFFIEVECLLPGDTGEGDIATVLKAQDEFVASLLGSPREHEKRSYKKLAIAARAVAAPTA